jgi:hypothetical protein
MSLWYAINVGYPDMEGNMKVNDCVRFVFDDPKMTDSDIDAIVWGCTGWPSFFIGDPVRTFVKQLYHAKRSLARGFTIDDIFSGKDKISK